MPIVDEKAPSEVSFDSMVNELRNISPDTACVFNCQVGHMFWDILCRTCMYCWTTNQLFRYRVSLYITTIPHPAPLIALQVYKKNMASGGFKNHTRSQVMWVFWCNSILSSISLASFGWLRWASCQHHWGLFKFIQREFLISNCQLISKLIVLFMFSFLRLAFQMGKGRTTTGMIVATLMADIAQAWEKRQRQILLPITFLAANWNFRGRTPTTSSRSSKQISKTTFSTFVFI